jgi:hypothetical protein
MSCCETKIIQVLGGGAGGGPFTVTPDSPAVGQTTVTDTASGNSFVIPAGDNMYNTDASLTGARVVDMAGFDLTFQNGGDFIIDGKLTVTGMIDPIGLQLTESNTTAVGATGAGKATLYSSDGTDGQTQNHPIWKDAAGVLHDLLDGGNNIYNVDGTLTGNRILSLNGDRLDFTDATTGTQYRFSPSQSRLFVENGAGTNSRVTQNPGSYTATTNFTGGGSTSIVSNATASAATTEVVLSSLFSGNGGRIVARGTGFELDANGLNAEIIDLGSSGLVLKPTNTVGLQSKMFMHESVNGGNYVEIRPPVTLASNTLFQYPPTNGTAGQFLQTDGSGITTWATPSSSSFGQSSVSILEASATDTTGAISGAGNSSSSITTVGSLISFSGTTNFTIGSDTTIFGGNSIQTAQAGVYEAELHIVTNAPFTANQVHVAQLVLNGATVIAAGAGSATVAGEPISMSCKRMISLAAFDSIRVALNTGPSGWRVKSMSLTLKRVQ